MNQKQIHRLMKIVWFDKKVYAKFFFLSFRHEYKLGPCEYIFSSVYDINIDVEVYLTTNRQKQSRVNFYFATPFIHYF